MMATADVQIQPTCDDKQITFDLDKKTIWYWRRVLLIRYYCELGKNHDVNVSWNDFDKANKVLALNDEDAPFVEKSPSTSLQRTMIQISHLESKIITITLYYSTKKCLIQGNSCQSWVEREFDKIKRSVEMCLKGSNPKQNIDNIVKRMNKVQLPSIPEVSLNSSQTTPKIIDDSFDSCLNISAEDSSKKNAVNSNMDHVDQKNKPENKSITKSPENKLPESEKDTDIQHKLVETIHSLENKLIECHTKYNERLENLNTIIKQWETKFYQLEKNHKQDVERNMGVILNNIDKKLESIEIKMSDFETKLSEKAQVNQMSKLERIVQEKLEVIEKRCEDVINTNTKINKLEAPNPLRNELNITLKAHERSADIEQNVQVRDSPNTRHNNTQHAQLWIVGTSLVKDLKKSLIYRSKSVTITTLRDKTIRGAQEFLESGKLSSDNILYQVGSNDLEEKEQTQVVKEIESLVINTKEKLPKCQIIVSQILPRYPRNQKLSHEYEEKRRKCNLLLQELCQHYEAPYVKHENLNQRHFYDGIHLSQNGGIGAYVLNLKEIINPLLGVIKQDVKGQSNYRGYTNGVNHFRDNFIPKFNRPNQGNRGNFNNNPEYQSGGYHRYNQDGGIQKSDINIRLLRLALGL